MSVYRATKKLYDLLDTLEDIMLDKVRELDSSLDEHLMGKILPPIMAWEQGDIVTDTITDGLDDEDVEALNQLVTLGYLKKQVD